MSIAEELASHTLQLKQVEAALLTEPENDELIKLKSDLEEIIALQKQLLEESGEKSDAPIETTSTSESGPIFKVGDHCMAPSANGQSHSAVVDGFMQDKASVTFIGSGTKAMVKVNELSKIPKDYDLTAAERSGKIHNRKSEWQVERERRRMRALKKEHRKKELEEAKEDEKKKWLTFNAKASSRSLKGLKRTTASGSAPDGPARGIIQQARISSRQDFGAFKSTQRGNMDSLF